MLNITSKLASLADNQLLRQRRIVSERHGKMFVINQHPMINFAGNDYLGLAQDPRVQHAFIEAVKLFGYGSGSSPLISGFSHAHQQLEEHLAALLGRERALLFNSGYHANIGVITCFAGRETRIIADKHCHASIIDAINMSRADLHRYHHLDHGHAEELLKKESSKQTLLISESIFSMSGAITDTPQLAALALKFNAMLMVDDAHGFGILGAHGYGVSEHFKLSAHEIPLLVTPLGKSVAGMGAIVSGERDIIEYLMQNARTYCYSTALPAANCAAALAALQIIESEPWHLQRLRTLIEYFNHAAMARGLCLISTDSTPIKCILSGTNTQTLQLQEKLLTNNIFVAAIRPPTVPRGTARLRISLSALHNETDISLLLDLLADHHEHRET
jgi:8-amino-7-oxononanoate synthase